MTQDKKPLFGATLLLLIFAAIAVRLFLFAYLSPQHNMDFFFQSDSYGYLSLAENISEGHGFSMSTTSPYLPDSFRTPAFPYITAAFIHVFGNPLSYIVFQIFLSGLLVVLSFLLALSISENRKVALGVAALVALEPYSIFIHLYFLTEVLFTILFVGGAYSLFRYVGDKRPMLLAYASALFGVASLVRPIAEFLPLVLAGAVVSLVPPRLYAKHLLYVFIPFLIVIGPWVVRNYEIFHFPGLSSGGLQNVYSDLGATIISIRDNVPWYKAKEALEADFEARHNVPKRAIQEDLSLSPILFKEGVKLMIENPVPTVLSAGTVAVAFFTNDLWSYHLQAWKLMPLFEYGFSPSSSLLHDGVFKTIERIIAATGGWLFVPLLGRLFWILVCIFCVIGFVSLWRMKGVARSRAILALVLILYFYALCISNGAGINGRYRFPEDVLLFTLAVLGCASLYRWIVSKVRHTSNAGGVKI